MDMTHANSMTAVAAQVIPRYFPPLYAAIPISFPYLFTASTALTMIAVAIADAMPMVMKAS